MVSHSILLLLTVVQSFLKSLLHDFNFELSASCIPCTSKVSNVTKLPICHKSDQAHVNCHRINLRRKNCGRVCPQTPQEGFDNIICAFSFATTFWQTEIFMQETCQQIMSHWVYSVGLSLWHAVCNKTPKLTRKERRKETSPFPSPFPLTIWPRSYFG